ncbi:MAG: pyruvate kinase [Spirochaetes bacterium]|nr:pyruvate kinase [Spirochaetota bacterium]
MSFSIIPTLGPATRTNERIIKLMEKATAFRLNASYLDVLQLEHWLNQLKQIFQDKDHFLPVVIDLQGAKMRIAQYPEVKELPINITLQLQHKSHHPEIIPVTHPELFQQINIGDELTLNDAKILLKVTQATSDEIKAQVVHNDSLRSYKGINRKNHPLKLNGLSEKDKALIDCANQFSFTRFAFSFVVDGTESSFIKEYTDRHLIAKIERPEAIPFLKKIDQLFDEIWFCRGDLGAQAGLQHLGRLQNHMVQLIPKLTHPLLLAGQVLEYMTHFPQPTRSEVVHLYNIINQGFAGIVLSDETAIGKNPEKVIELLKKIIT